MLRYRIIMPCTPAYINEAGHPARRVWRTPMKTMIFAALAAMIGIGVANAASTRSATAPIQQDSTADWANG
jgi:hypothetical protein